MHLSTRPVGDALEVQLQIKPEPCNRPTSAYQVARQAFAHGGAIRPFALVAEHLPGPLHNSLTRRHFEAHRSVGAAFPDRLNAAFIGAYRYLPEAPSLISKSGR